MITVELHGVSDGEAAQLKERIFAATAHLPGAADILVSNAETTYRDRTGECHYFIRLVGVSSARLQGVRTAILGIKLADRPAPIIELMNVRS